MSQMVYYNNLIKSSIAHKLLLYYYKVKEIDFTINLQNRFYFISLHLKSFFPDYKLGKGTCSIKTF
jgi:hypothetical protein